MTLDIALLKRCIGWTPDTWSKPLASFLQEANIDSAQHALEIGAGAMSSLSPYLTLMADQVLCSYYDPQFLDDIKTRNAHICKHANPPIAEEKITYQQLDVTNLPDQQWDIIVMKSILGGVFREDLSSFDDATHLLRQIREKNLTTSGKLILIENGKSILEPLLKNHGARKNHWRFFENDSFPEACYHSSFGVLSAFSFRSRVPKLGAFLEKALFLIDIPLSKLITRHTVHLWVFDALPPLDD